MLLPILIGFSPKYNGSLNSIHVCSITAPSLIKSLTETCDDINVIIIRCYSNGNIGDLPGVFNV